MDSESPSISHADFYVWDRVLELIEISGIQSTNDGTDVTLIISYNGFEIELKTTYSRNNLFRINQLCKTLRKAYDLPFCSTTTSIFRNKYLYEVKGGNNE